MMHGELVDRKFVQCVGALHAQGLEVLRLSLRQEFGE
jgi:hypothetical protein